MNASPMPELYAAIHGTLLPLFNIPEPRRAQVAGELLPRARIYHTTKYQLLEEPGTARNCNLP